MYCSEFKKRPVPAPQPPTSFQAGPLRPPGHRPASLPLPSEQQSLGSPQVVPWGPRSPDRGGSLQSPQDTKGRPGLLALRRSCPKPRSGTRLKGTKARPHWAQGQPQRVLVMMLGVRGQGEQEVLRAGGAQNRDKKRSWSLREMGHKEVGMGSGCPGWGHSAAKVCGGTPRALGGPSLPLSSLHHSRTPHP